MLGLLSNSPQSEEFLFAGRKDEGVATRGATQVLVGYFMKGHDVSILTKVSADLIAPFGPLRVCDALCRYGDLQIYGNGGQRGVHRSLTACIDRHQRQSRATDWHPDAVQGVLQRNR